MTPIASVCGWLSCCLCRLGAPRNRPFPGLPTVLRLPRSTVPQTSPGTVCRIGYCGTAFWDDRHMTTSPAQRGAKLDEIPVPKRLKTSAYPPSSAAILVPTIMKSHMAVTFHDSWHFFSELAPRPRKPDSR